MWREIPDDTAWWEVEIEPEDLDRVRVFPRAQWRKVANGSFLIKDIAQRIRHQRFYGKTRDFVTRVQALSYKLRESDDQSAVLLIGLDDTPAGHGAGRQSSADGGFAGLARDSALAGFACSVVSRRACQSPAGTRRT